jgi:hypothetical protein
VPYADLFRYLSADYERGVFNVSACAWNEDADEHIVTITSKSFNSSACSGSGCSTDGSSSGNSPSLSNGAVAGIAIAALVGVVILAAVLFFFIRRQRQKSAYKATPPEPDVSVLSGPVHNAPPSDPSDQFPRHPRFWSPDAILSGASDSYNGQSSTSGGNHEQSVDEHGMELDGDGTEVQPVYHELAGREVKQTELEPATQPSHPPYV